MMEEVTLKNRFICNYDNCRRILSTGGFKSFPCTSCGHGQMKLIKPTAYCMECRSPIYGNVTPPNERVPFYGGRDYVDVICSRCTHGKVEEIEGWEKLLHTKFTDTDDYNEKIALYEAKVREAEEANTDVSKIRVKSFGERLKILRKKLKLTQKQLSEHINITERGIRNYEKSLRQLPKEIKEWVKTSESTFKHIGREKGEARIMSTINEAFLQGNE